MKATIKMRKRPIKGKQFKFKFQLQFFFQGPSQSFHLRDWNALSLKWRLLKRSKGFLFFSLYFLVINNYCSEKKRLKTGEDNSYLLPTPVASMNKIQGIISLSQLFCLALGWHFFKSTSSSSSPSSIDLNWTFKHKKNWYRRLEGISQWWRVNTYRGSWTP